jgi:hypothetical protein
MSLFPGTPKTPGLESRNCPSGVPGLWELITLDCKVWSQRGLNQTCSPRRDLSNDVSHFQFGGREEVDSRLLVVGSQIVNLTPGPSFAHNLSYRCSNDQCEAIFYIYASRPFPMAPRTPQFEVFRALLSNSKHSGVPEYSKSPTLEVLGFTPTLGQSGVATDNNVRLFWRYHIRHNVIQYMVFKHWKIHVICQDQCYFGTNHYQHFYMNSNTCSPWQKKSQRYPIENCSTLDIIWHNNFANSSNLVRVKFELCCYHSTWHW